MDLFQTVESLKGVGPKTAEVLRKYGIRTVKDFLYNLPRDYENFEAPISISEIRPGKVVVRGQIDSLKTRRARRRNLSITEGVVRDKTGAIKVIWFNQSYRVRQFVAGKEYYFTGNYELKNGRYSLISPSTAEVSEIDPSVGLSPIYVSHGALKSQDFKRLIRNSKDKFTLIPDLLPTVSPDTRKKALFFAHFPNSLKSVAGARDYLAYEELFELILASKLNRSENEKLKSVSIPFNQGKIREFVGKLPFKLTNAQRRATWEIFQDLEKDVPMNRLLQGDVGSGKTMVSAMSAYGTILSGRQVVLLAPTAILATQHYKGLLQILEPFGVKLALLTGATKQKVELKRAISKGEIDFVIGTHALLTDDTEFSNLALVIIDEQHRFGVEQRQKLLLKSPKGLAPHLLSMTATPIPRSLQLTVFGDLDVSVLDELPKGRQPISTTILKEIETREILFPKIREVTDSGGQIYWVCKAIDDNPKTETTSVKSRCEKLKQVFPNIKIEFLHGRMKPAEKDEIMGRFSRGETKILVSTTVIEVGVDVPNASLIVIENAENYGLAQLHQLRGRVGRGSVKSFCYLLTSGEMAPSRRLRELEKSNNGFYLAEVDLKLRGPGEIYGALQHGALDLRIATLTDTKLISRAQKDVDVFLKNPENMVKYKELMTGIKRYQQITTLN
ncbi:ATP-dependent DNA helicase RecG [Candidatus Saccharibacteria bacterium]|nr:ATP-dependent DNA helicase RecG [Candidatus Saccharibacteria bacterium]